jgi:hypothetical protein
VTSTSSCRRGEECGLLAALRVCAVLFASVGLMPLARSLVNEADQALEAVTAAWVCLLRGAGYHLLPTSINTLIFTFF